MGIIRETLSKGIDIVREEILPLRHDLIKAGILKPDEMAYDPKASLVDPWGQQSLSYGYKEKYSILDYSKCRQITYADPIVSAVIQTRLNQAASFAVPQYDKYKTGFKIKMRDSGGAPSGGDKKRIKEIEHFIVNCGVPESFEDTPEIKRRDNFDTFLRKIIRDSLTFDQINFEVTPRRNGQPYCFQAVDASTIRMISDRKEVSEQLGGHDAFNNTNHIPFSSSKDFKQFKPKHPRYVQIINGVVRHVFDEWEMAFGVRNPRTDILANGYGFSEIEMLITTITAHMNAETYNRKFFSQGSSIKGVLAFEGSVPPDQLEAFRRQWYAQVTGVNNAWKTPIMALGKDGKLNWTSLHANNREMEFGKWMDYCIKTICGVFQIDPIEIGFDISKQGSGQSGGSSGLGQGNQAERVMYSQDKGLRPLLRHIQYLINDYIVYRIDPNYEFEFIGLNVDSEKDDLDRQVQQVKSFKTVNEVRAEHDLPPLKKVDDIKKMNIGDIILDPQFMQALGQVAAPDEPQMGMGPDGQPMAPGEEGGAPEEVEAGDEGDEEPDYENMSEEELQAEIEKLQSGEDQAPKSKDKGKGKPALKVVDKKKTAPQKAAPSKGKGGDLVSPQASDMAKAFFKEIEL